MSKWTTIILALLSICAVCTTVTADTNMAYSIYIPMVAGRPSVDDIYGVALPLPDGVELKRADDREYDYYFETDRPPEDILIYLNLNWPRSGVDGFVPMRASGSGLDSSVVGEDRYERITWVYSGRFGNNDIAFDLSVEDIQDVENGEEVTRKTFVSIVQRDDLEIKLPETNVDRAPSIYISLLFNDPEIDWENMPLPEGRGDEDGEDYELEIDRPALDVATQMNDEWRDAGFTGEIDVEDRAERVVWHSVNNGPRVTETFYSYHGRFERDGIYYSIQVDAKAEEIDSNSKVYIFPNWLSPEESLRDLIASGGVPLPTAAVLHDDGWDEYTASFDMSTDALRAYLNETWPNNGIEGEIGEEPQGRWVSDNPLAEQVYYGGRFNDEATRSAYLVRVFDLAGQEQTILKIQQLRIEEADALGY